MCQENLGCECTPRARSGLIRICRLEEYDSVIGVTVHNARTPRLLILTDNDATAGDRLCESVVPKNYQ